MWNVTLQSICLAIIIKKKPVWLNRNSQFVSPNVQLVPNVHVSQTLISRQVKKFWDKVWWLTLATWSWTILLFEQTWLWTLWTFCNFENRPKIIFATCAIVHLHCMFDALLYINLLMWKPKIQSLCSCILLVSEIAQIAAPYANLFKTCDSWLRLVQNAP